MVRFGADSPQAVAKVSDIVFTMVGFPEDVQDVILGSNGVLTGMKSGGTVVDMTTSCPDLAKTIYERCAERGIGALDAPVSGGDIGAREATLAIMVGGDPAVFEVIEPLFGLLGKTIALMGGAGAGQHTKMTQSDPYCRNHDRRGGYPFYTQREPEWPLTGSSISLEKGRQAHGPSIRWSTHRRWRLLSGFYIKHFVKDMKIALDAAHRMRLSLPGLALVNQFYLSAMALGWESLGTQGLYRVLKNHEPIKAIGGFTDSMERGPDSERTRYRHPTAKILRWKASYPPHR